MNKTTLEMILPLSSGFLIKESPIPMVNKSRAALLKSKANFIIMPMMALK